MEGYWFTSSLFEVELGEDREVNPRMYGRQLAVWLKKQLERRGYTIEPIIAEDWGRCLMCSRDPFMLWVGCGNVTDPDSATPDSPAPHKDAIVWYCFPMAEAPSWKRLFKKVDTSADLARLNADLRAILSEDPGIELVERP